MTKEEYIHNLKEKRLRNSKIVISILVLSISFIVFAYLEVTKGILYPLPIQIADYLSNTFIDKFSSDQLSNLLLINTGSVDLLHFLLFIYYGYFVSTILVLILIGFLFAFLLKFKPLRSVRQSLIIIHNIIELINQKRVKGNIVLKNRLIFYKYHLSDSISPIMPRWFAFPSYQWLTPDSISSPERSIIFSLSKYVDALQEFLDNKKDVIPFLEPLSKLEEFLWSVLQRSEKKLRSHRFDISTSANYEKECLLAFVRYVRPLIIQANRYKQKEPAQSRLKRMCTRLFESKSIRISLLISGGSASVMLLGVLLFKIDPSQAFLTWFTVTFGSFTISIGVSAISIVSQKDKSNVDGDATAS